MNKLVLARMYWRLHVECHHMGARILARDALDCWFDICERALQDLMRCEKAK